MFPLANDSFFFPYAPQPFVSEISQSPICAQTPLEISPSLHLLLLSSTVCQSVGQNRFLIRSKSFPTDFLLQISPSCECKPLKPRPFFKGERDILGLTEKVELWQESGTSKSKIIIELTEKETSRTLTREIPIIELYPSSMAPLFKELGESGSLSITFSSFCVLSDYFLGSNSEQLHVFFRRAPTLEFFETFKPSSHLEIIEFPGIITEIQSLSNEQTALVTWQTPFSLNESSGPICASLSIDFLDFTDHFNEKRVSFVENIRETIRISTLVKGNKALLALSHDGALIVVWEETKRPSKLKKETIDKFQVRKLWKQASKKTKTEFLIILTGNPSTQNKEMPPNQKEEDPVGQPNEIVVFELPKYIENSKDELLMVKRFQFSLLEEFRLFRVCRVIIGEEETAYLAGRSLKKPFERKLIPFKKQKTTKSISSTVEIQKESRVISAREGLFVVQDLKTQRMFLYSVTPKGEKSLVMILESVPKKNFEVIFDSQRSSHVFIGFESFEGFQDVSEGKKAGIKLQKQKKTIFHFAISQRETACNSRKGMETSKEAKGILSLSSEFKDFVIEKIHPLSSVFFLAFSKNSIIVLKIAKPNPNSAQNRELRAVAVFNYPKGKEKDEENKPVAQELEGFKKELQGCTSGLRKFICGVGNSPKSCVADCKVIQKKALGFGCFEFFRFLVVTSFDTIDLMSFNELDGSLVLAQRSMLFSSKLRLIHSLELPEDENSKKRGSQENRLEKTKGTREESRNNSKFLLLFQEEAMVKVWDVGSGASGVKFLSSWEESEGKRAAGCFLNPETVLLCPEKPETKSAKSINVNSLQSVILKLN